MQTDALDELNDARYTGQHIKEIVKGSFSEEYKNEYRKLGRLLAHCEHFAVGINEGVYDYDTTCKLGGEHLYYLYQKYEPVITLKRKGDLSGTRYRNLELLARNIGRDLSLNKVCDSS